MFLWREPTAEPSSLERSPEDLLSINFIISFGICSTPKESKYFTVLLFTDNATQ